MRLLTLILAAVIAGCATAISGTQQEVYIQAVRALDNQPLPGTRCAITDRSGTRYAMGVNPDTLLIRRGFGKLTISCIRPGYHQVSVAGCPHLNPFVLGDLFYLPTAAIDIAAGTVLDYPHFVTVLMEKDANTVYLPTPIVYDLQPAPLVIEQSVYSEQKHHQEIASINAASSTIGAVQVLP